MPDVPRSSFTVGPEFVDGEAPLSAKFNVLTVLVNNIADTLESYIGDIWGESWPYSLYSDYKLSLPYGRKSTTDEPVAYNVSRHLDIVNLSRIIGPASYLNPTVLEEEEVTDYVPSGYNQFQLTYLPSGSVTFSDTTVFATLVGSHAAVQASGDYYIDSDGNVYSWDEMDGGTAIYNQDPVANNGLNSPQGARFNTLPDLAQCEYGAGVSISSESGDGSRLITLPTVTHYLYNKNNTTTVLTDEDGLKGQSLKLPLVLTENLTVGEQIPTGFIYLKNWTTGETYYEAEFYYVSETVVKVYFASVADAISNGDVFYLVTVGSDITSSIADLRKKANHSHDRSFGEPSVSVRDLTDRFQYASQSGIFVESEIPGNVFPQYLHRDGWTDGVDSESNDENVMRGHLALGASFSLVPGSVGVSPNTAARQATSYKTASHKLCFLGAQLANCVPYIRQEDSALILSGDGGGSDSGATVSAAQATGKYGVRVRDSHFVPEYGITGALSANEWNVMPIGIKEESLAFSVPIVLDLGTDYGVDPLAYDVMSVDIMLSEDTTNSWYKPTDNSATNREFYVYYDESSNEVYIYPTGSAWLSGPSLYKVRGVIWLNRLS